MRQIKLIPFGTTTLKGNDCLNYVFVAFVADTVLDKSYIETGIKVPTVLMKHRLNGSVGFIGGIVNENESLIVALSSHVYNQTGLVFGFEEDRIIPVSSHLVTDDSIGLEAIHHLYYVKIKESSISKIMIGLIDCGFKTSNNGSFVIPIANFKSSKPAGLKRFLKPYGLENAAETVSDEFILLADLLAETITDEPMKASVRETLDSVQLSNPIEPGVETSFKVESEHSEKYAYGIATVGTMTLAHVTPTVYLTEEEAAKMPNAFKLGEQSSPRTVLAPDGINTITYSNPNISISTDAMVKANAIYEALAGEEPIEKVDLESIKKPSEPEYVQVENYSSSSNNYSDSGSSDSSGD